MHVYTMSQIIFDACLHDVTNNISMSQIIFAACLHDVTNNIWQTLSQIFDACLHDVQIIFDAC